ncbi:MAG: hypothetical protein HYV07_05885 [Deltaproteobacteria bacterium]|nr:hypothetical protein [Deltaproteobacteria bacterium]
MTMIKRNDGHRDLTRFQNTLHEARADGRISGSEKADLKRAFAQLEPGEKQQVAPKKLQQPRGVHR